MPWLLKRHPLNPTDALTRRIYENIAKSPGQQLVDQYAAFTVVEHNQSSLFALEYWAMYRRGELSEQETPATWAVLMRAVDTSEAVRMLLEVTAIDSERQPFGLATTSNFSVPRAAHSATLNLHVYCKNTLHQLNGYVSPQRIAKVKGQFLPKLRAAASQLDGTQVIVMSPIDAELFLMACETAAKAKLEGQAANG